MKKAFIKNKNNIIFINNIFNNKEKYKNIMEKNIYINYLQIFLLNLITEVKN